MNNMLMNKKVSLMNVLLTMVFLSILFLGGCGCSNQNSDSSFSESNAQSLQKKLDIKEFDWNVGQSKSNGKDIYTLSLTNNSKYELLAVEIKYTTKPGLTPEQLSIFDDFVNKHASYIKAGQSNNDVNLQGKEEMYVASKGVIENIPLRLGIGDFSWRNNPSTQEFDLMEPDELQLAVVYDDVLYFAYYDFSTGIWKMDSKSVKLNNWPTTESASLIPKVDKHIYKTETYDSLNTTKVDVYNVTLEEYNTYIENLKKNGFSEGVDEKDYNSNKTWEAKDKNDNKVKLDYNVEKKKLVIEVEGKTNK